MKITKLLIAMMAAAIVFASCEKDEDEEDVQPRTRLVKVEITSSAYNQTDIYTYNENNQVVEHSYTFEGESSTTEKNTTYTYNENGEPVEWEQTGNGYGNGITTIEINSDNIVETEPDGDEVTYSLNSDDKITNSDDGTFQYNYYYDGDNLDRKEGLLSYKYEYDLSKDNVIPALGINHWTKSENLVTENWLYNYDEISDKALLLDYDFEFNEDGTPATATLYHDFYSDTEIYVTYTYEEY